MVGVGHFTIFFEFVAYFVLGTDVHLKLPKLVSIHLLSISILLTLFCRERNSKESRSDRDMKPSGARTRIIILPMFLQDATPHEGVVANEDPLEYRPHPSHVDRPSPEYS